MAISHLSSCVCVHRRVRPYTRACEHGVGEGRREYDYRFVNFFLL